MALSGPERITLEIYDRFTFMGIGNEVLLVWKIRTFIFLYSNKITVTFFDFFKLGVISRDTSSF